MHGSFKVMEVLEGRGREVDTDKGQSTVSFNFNAADHIGAMETSGFNVPFAVIVASDQGNTALMLAGLRANN